MSGDTSWSSSEREPLRQPGDTHTLSIPAAEVMKEVFFDDVKPMDNMGADDFAD